jgi:hypothetical protein
MPLLPISAVYVRKEQYGSKLDVDFFSCFNQVNKIFGPFRPKPNRGSAPAFYGKENLDPGFWGTKMIKFYN